MRKVLQILGHQRWIRFGLRDRIIRLFHNPDTAKQESFEVTFFGKRYQGDFSTYLDWSTFYYGAYCIEELEFMKDAVNGEPEPIIIDIGANIGVHTLFASTIAREVHAFEPFPEVAQKIKEKALINNLKNIHLHPIGLGNNNNSLPYNPPKSSNTGTGSFIYGDETNGPILLPIRVGDEYFLEKGINSISFIKIDVEGFEGFVFEGIKKSISKQRPVVFYEWSDYSIKNEFNIRSFFPADYSFFDFEVDSILLNFFAKPGYKIAKITACSGNKIAIPLEKIDQFKEHYSHTLEPDPS